MYLGAGQVTVVTNGDVDGGEHKGGPWEAEEGLSHGGHHPIPAEAAKPDHAVNDAHLRVLCVCVCVSMLLSTILCTAIKKETMWIPPLTSRARGRTLLYRTKA